MLFKDIPANAVFKIGNKRYMKDDTPDERVNAYNLASISLTWINPDTDCELIANNYQEYLRSKAD